MNFQNIGSPVVKRAIVPKRGSFSMFDYGQIEPRLTAYFAEKIGFPEFADQIRAGVDCYTAVAYLVTGKDKVSAEERETWKRAYLSLLYGGGVRTIQEQFVISQAEARKMIKTFHANWPAVRKLQDKTIAVATRRGFITTPWGRQLHPEPYGEHKLLNKLIQGSAADLMKASLIRVDKMLSDSILSSRMVSVIHDEIIFDGPEDEIDWLHSGVPPCMREDWLHDVIPIEIDHEVSTTSWAEKLSYDEWQTARKEQLVGNS